MYVSYVWKTVGTAFQWIVFFQLRREIYKFLGTRIWEWNIAELDLLQLKQFILKVFSPPGLINSHLSRPVSAPDEDKEKGGHMDMDEDQDQGKGQGKRQGQGQEADQ